MAYSEIMFIKFLLEHSFSHFFFFLHIVHGCFCVKVTELSNCDRN